ncbi:MAG: S1 RNA-binding domain-containing protein, partial [Alphaproteobacteria bacterium]|nr:S1 RNA-binding domain-containing protein [Alphaproteobacteria bacterium]
TSQEVEVAVLEIDNEKRRIALSLKQCTENPWHNFAELYPVGTKIKGEIKNITEFGLFIGLENGIDGMVHISDLDWKLSGDEALAQFEKGQNVETVVRDIDIEKERVSLGIKQLVDDPMAGLNKLKRGAVVTCTVNAVKESGIEVSISEIDAPIFIRRSDLSRDREDQRTDRFEKGEKLDAIVVSLDPKKRHIGLSVKALEVAEEKEAVAQYGSSDSGALLGDILGAVLTRGGSKKKKAEKPTDELDDKPADKLADDSKTPTAKTVDKEKQESDSTEKTPSKEIKSAAKKPATKKQTAKTQTENKTAKKQADKAESKEPESKAKEPESKAPESKAKESSKSKDESKPKARSTAKTTRKTASKVKEAKPAKTAKKDEKTTVKPQNKPKTAKTDKTDSDN